MNYSTIAQSYSIIPFENLSRSNNWQNNLPKTIDGRMFNEKSPLIYGRAERRRTKTVESICNWRVCTLFIILTLGLSIGIYLLAIEYHEQSVNFRFNLVELDDWYGENASVILFLNETRLQLPVTNIIVSHTRGDHCYTIPECSTLLSEMIRADPSIPYNFLISGAGDSYEVRGWNYASNLPVILDKSASIVVGFIGDFTANTLSDEQFAELKAFINEAIRRNELNKTFNLFGAESDLKMHETLDDIEQWSGTL